MMKAIESLNQQDKVIVISNRKKAFGVTRAKRRGIQCYYFSPSTSWGELNQFLKKISVSHIFLLGFMKIVPPDFIKDWKEKIFNIHPSLLPAYPGLESIKRAYDDKALIGATVHKVIEQVDAGEYLYQSSIGNYEGLNLEEVEWKVHLLEHRIVKQMVMKCS